MDFSAFDTTEMDSYSAQAKEKWGTTEAYKEFEQKTAGQAREQMRSTGDALMDIFAQFGAIRHLSPAAPEAQALVEQLQRYITDHIAREWRNQMDLISVTVEGEGSHRYVVIEVRPGDPVSLDDRYYFRIGSECREVTEEGREGWLERRRALLRQMKQTQN